jgi:CRISPR-associated protein Csc3
MKKTANDLPEEQIGLFDTMMEAEQTDLPEEEIDFSEEESEIDQGDRTWPDEPLFVALLRNAVQKQWGQDRVLNDFVSFVAPPLSESLGHVTAKGGDFAARKRADAEQRGEDITRIQEYAADQSMRAHLVNGLFPVLHVAKTLHRWAAPQFRYYDDTVRRLFIAGYVLHDWLKLPEVDAELERAGLRHDQVNAAQHRQIVETVFLGWGQRLGLDRFLNEIGGLQVNLHELIFLASNTQVKWGTLRNLAALPELHLPGAQRSLAEQLCRLADYLAYIGKTPREAATNSAIHGVLATLSNQQATFVYHHIADIRGVLTNLIQNAALDAMQSDDCVPLLYAPSGVVYLARRGTWQVSDVSEIGEAVIERVRQVARRVLISNLTGFGRDGKGMKYADYYGLFFSGLDMVSIGLQATMKVVHPNKEPSAGKRWDKLSGWMDVGMTREEMEDVRVDQLAEWLYLAEKVARESPGGVDAPRVMIEDLGMLDLYQDFLAVPRDSRAGGVGYHWYFLAGHFLKRNRGLDPQAWEERIRAVARTLVGYLQQQEQDHPSSTTVQNDGFDDLREYVGHVLTFGPIEKDVVRTSDTNRFETELTRYGASKKRGKEAMCSLCSSSYTVDKQQESAILFAPQVYSNKLGLHGADALRNICSICGLEIMLRQLLMNDSAAVGGNFEGRKLRYLFFYPTYFFTPETLSLFRLIQDNLRGMSFTELRKQLLEKEDGATTLDFSPGHWQRLQDLLLAPNDSSTVGKDRFLRMHFPENEAITFFFMGVPPPGRDAKDAEAWALPAFLALVLPLCVDVKVVASETSLPFVNEADEFNETIMFDSAHAAIGYLLGEERINLDHVLPLLNRLTVAYFIHLDANARMAKGKFDYRWQDLPPLARSLSASSVFAFHYLKKWQRANRLDSIPADKARIYLQYQSLLSRTTLYDQGERDMSHARTLTELYRRFYRAKGRASSNAILRPISVASKAVLTADRRIYVDAEGLVEIVRGELFGFVDRVAGKRADGYVPRIEVDGKRVVDEVAIQQFAAYFVNDLFYGALRGDVSALRGRQLNLLKNACEVIYRDLDTQYWAERKEAESDDDSDEESQVQERLLD